MGIILRQNKGSELTFGEVDSNFQSLIYSASYNDNNGELTFFYPSASTLTVDISGIGGATLQQNLISNQNVGNISSGDTFLAGSSIEALLRDMLIGFIAPTLSNLRIRNGSTNVDSSPVEIGDSFTADNVIFNTTADNPDGNFPFSASLVSAGHTTPPSPINQYIGNDSLGNSNIENFTSTLFNRNSAGNVTFTINAEDKDGNSISTSRTISYRALSVFGGSSTNLNSSGLGSAQTVFNNIKSQQSSLASNKDETFNGNSNTQNVNNYTYYFYNSSFGTLSNFVLNDLSYAIGTAWINLGTTSITNDFGESITYRIYQSNQPGAYLSTDEIAFN